MCGKSSPRKTPAKIRILIVDDQPLIRRGLASLIDNNPDLIICAAAGTCQAGLEAIASSGPDLVIAGLSLKAEDGLEMIKAIRRRYSHVPVLVHSMHVAPLYAQRALQAGASGYVTKQETSETLLIAIRRLLDGEKYVSPKIQARLDLR